MERGEQHVMEPEVWDDLGPLDLQFLRRLLGEPAAEHLEGLAGALLRKTLCSCEGAEQLRDRFTLVAQVVLAGDENGHLQVDLGRQLECPLAEAPARALAERRGHGDCIDVSGLERVGQAIGREIDDVDLARWNRAQREQRLEEELGRRARGTPTRFPRRSAAEAIPITSGHDGNVFVRVMEAREDPDARVLERPQGDGSQEGHRDVRLALQHRVERIPAQIEVYELDREALVGEEPLLLRDEHEGDGR
jgi:hypothetical protein